ncbi:MAG: hypothetical protein ACE5F1_00905, partial [Planctomycetota bacterium]
AGEISYIDMPFDGDELTEASRKVVALQEKLVGSQARPYYLVMDPSDRRVLGRHTLSLLDQEAKLLVFLGEARKAWQRRHEKIVKKPR